MSDQLVGVVRMNDTRDASISVCVMSVTLYSLRMYVFFVEHSLVLVN